MPKIEEAAGFNIGELSYFEKDPWGAPYLLDENEDEIAADPCRFDTLRIAGPDGYLDGSQPGTTNDGKILILSPKSCPGAY